MQVETELDMVRRHIDEGERLVIRQMDVVVALSSGGGNLGGAERLLQALVDSLQLHRDHLARLTRLTSDEVGLKA